MTTLVRSRLPWVLLGGLTLGAGVLLYARSAPRDVPAVEVRPQTAPTTRDMKREAESAPSSPRIAPPSDDGSRPAEAQREPLEVLSVLSVDGRLFALTSRPPDVAATPLSPKRRVTLALPGGGALSVTPRKSIDGELSDGLWTVVAEDGTCLVQPGTSAELRVDSGSLEGGGTETLAAVELVGCAATIDTTDSALALSGPHPEARFESLAGAPCNEVAAARLPALLDASETDGFDPEAVVSTGDTSFVLYRSAGDDTTLRVVSVRGADTALVLEQPGLPLWFGGVGDEPPGC